MSLGNPPSSPPPPLPSVPPPSSPAPRGRGGRFFLFGCGTIIALALIVVATVAFTIWWIQRPIKPVVLSPREKATVDQKLQRLEAGNSANPSAQPGKQPYQPGQSAEAPATRPGSGPE